MGCKQVVAGCIRVAGELQTRYNSDVRQMHLSLSKPASGAKSATERSCVMCDPFAGVAGMLPRCRPCSAVEGIRAISGRERSRSRGYHEATGPAAHPAGTAAICKASRGSTS